MRALRWGGGLPHRSVAAWVMALTLVAVACGGDDDDAPDVAPAEATDTTVGPTTTAGPTTTVGPTTTTTAAPDTTTTAIPTTSEPDDVAPATGMVEPVAVCADEGGAAYFGYRSTASEPISIPVGEANRVTYEDGTVVTEQQPEVFAPGEHGAVFWTDGGSWTLIGPDGEPRTAHADDAPGCPGTGPPLDQPDNREARLISTVDERGDTVTITITVEGIPDESRCPAGPDIWTPVPPDVRITTDALNATLEDGADGSTVRFTIDDPAAPATESGVVGYAAILVAVDVDDRCTGPDDLTASMWGASPFLLDLSQDPPNLCFGATDEGYGDVECDPGIPATGGIRVR